MIILEFGGLTSLPYHSGREGDVSDARLDMGELQHEASARYSDRTV